MRARDDRGSIAPLVLLFFVMAALVVSGTIAASTAFLAQRDLAGVCDAAAVTAASAVSEAGVYEGTDTESLPLSEESVSVALADFSAREYAGDPDGLEITGGTDGTTVGVTCRRTVPIPFGSVFGYGDGLPRMANSSARAPLR